MNLINELLQLCIEKNETTEHDVFFEFSGHINTVRFYYYKNGFNKSEISISSKFIKMDDEKELKKAIQEVKELV